MRQLGFSVLTLAIVAGAAAAQRQAGAPATAVLRGTYSTTVVRADIPHDAPADVADSVPGKWSLTFAAGKPVMVALNGKAVVTAPATFHADTMSLGADDTGPDKCGVGAVYTYALTKGTLVFRSVGEDKCAGRWVVLTKHPFKRGM